MTCPNCGSYRITPVSEIESKTKGFDCCSGFLGYLILGPFGWLCGLCGMGDSVTRTKVLYVCSDCGRKYNDTSELDPEMRRVN